MKILNIKFKNINSLSGENQIDFTDPIFTTDGLFAITGKTGAGKSSILDAISLALYGKTPRVEVTGSENAVMTRGEKDCYSEIIFEVAGRKWKSSWKQELNRNGNLKPVVRTIADANDKILTDQVRACDAKIVEILGLTFEQFTKVIMLAQGSFAAFLQADKNVKGELLEQITGTEIYAEISKTVFDRNRTEKEKLSKILIELEAIKILSDDEIKTLSEEIAGLEHEKKQADEQIKKIEVAKTWLTELQTLQQQINDAKLKMPDLEKAEKTAQEDFEKAVNSLLDVKAVQQAQESVFKAVRELDVKISEKTDLLNPIFSSISNLESSMKGLSDKLEKQNTEFKNANKSLLEKQDWAIKNKIYKELVSDYTAIENENKLLNIALQDLNNQKNTIAELTQDLNEKVDAVNSATEIFIEKEKILTSKNEELEVKKSELADIVKGKELSDLQSDLEIVISFGTHIKNLIDTVTSIKKNEKEIDDLKKKLDDATQIRGNLSNQIEADKEASNNLQDQIDLLEENIILTKTIQSLDEHRLNLKDGEACPLCGAIEHPFAIGNVPEMGEKEKDLSELKAKHRDMLIALQNMDKKLTKLDSNNDNWLINRRKEENNLLENQAKYSEILSEILTLQPNFSITDEEDKLAELTRIHAQKQNEYKQISGVIKNASDVEKQLKRLRDKEIPDLQQAKQTAERDKNSAETAKKIARQVLDDKKDTLAKTQTNCDADSARFSEKLLRYNVENIEALKKCLNNWNDNIAQTEELKTQIVNLEKSISLNNNTLENHKISLKNKQDEQQSIHNEKQKLVEERNEIFGEKSVDEEEDKLKSVFENAETAKLNAEKNKNEVHTEVAKNKAVITEKENDFKAKENLKITEKTFDELQIEFAEKKKTADELSEKIGGNNQLLKTNENNLKTFGSKLKEREKQQDICRKWGALNELIGASDGKKYRNFAQALTFEHLISLSNLQLRKMSERYILKRTGDASNPFELSVIDNFQNSEERTAQNLSGGEKFIVSLSLALGLANMASKNMRIDTMFIDEGFGTLDADYLDLALNALANLQSEGKIIGVISHLTELKERIATHIEVVPSGNGHSKIQLTS